LGDLTEAENRWSEAIRRRSGTGRFTWWQRKEKFKFSKKYAMQKLGDLNHECCTLKYQGIYRSEAHMGDIE
jgi:hypothetical protein